MEKLHQEIIDYCKAQEPYEACGFIKGNNFYPCANVADNPCDDFIIAKQDYDPNAQIIVHSHPQGEAVLSIADRISQNRTGLDWWLVCENNIKKYRFAPFLKGRNFEYGKSDCCSIIEDAFMLMNCFDTQFPRKGEQDDIASGALIRYMKEAGFNQISNQNDSLKFVLPGDVIVTSVGANANHASLYLGNNQVLHHRYNNLSRVETIGGIWFKAVHSVWRFPTFKAQMLKAIENDFKAGDLWQQ